MGIFNALAELFQPLLNAIGLGKHHADEPMRKLPFPGLRSAIKQKIAVGKFRRMQAEQAKRLVAQRKAMQKARQHNIQQPGFQKRRIRS